MKSRTDTAQTCTIITHNKPTEAQARNKIEQIELLFKERYGTNKREAGTNANTKTIGTKLPGKQR